MGDIQKNIVDRQERDKIISLVTSFLKQKISVDDFLEKLPRVGEDPIVKGIRQVLGDLETACHADDVIKAKSADKSLDLWRRSILFLKSDSPYLWPDVNWNRIKPSLLIDAGTIITIMILSFMLSELLKNAILLWAGISLIIVYLIFSFKNRFASWKEDAILKNFGGDSNFWPFIKKEELEKVENI